MSSRVGWYIASPGVYMFHMLKHPNDKPEYDNYNARDFISVWTIAEYGDLK